MCLKSRIFVGKWQLLKERLDLKLTEQRRDAGDVKEHRARSTRTCTCTSIKRTRIHESPLVSISKLRAVTLKCCYSIFWRNDRRWETSSYLFCRYSSVGEDILFTVWIIMSVSLISFVFVMYSSAIIYAIRVFPERGFLRQKKFRNGNVFSNLVCMQLGRKHHPNLFHLRTSVSYRIFFFKMTTFCAVTRRTSRKANIYNRTDYNPHK